MHTGIHRVHMGIHWVHTGVHWPGAHTGVHWVHTGVHWVHTGVHWVHTGIHWVEREWGLSGGVSGPSGVVSYFRLHLCSYQERSGRESMLQQLISMFTRFRKVRKEN